MKMRPWKCKEMVFITSEKVKIWLNIGRGTQGNSSRKIIFHNKIKGQDWIMLRYESRCNHEGLGIHYKRSTPTNQNAQWNQGVKNII
jgi:hypothetical protein